MSVWSACLNFGKQCDEGEKGGLHVVTVSSFPGFSFHPPKKGYSHLFPGRSLNFPQDWDCSSVCKLINCPIYWSSDSCLFSVFFLSMLSQKFFSQMLNLKNFKWSERCGFHPTGWWHQEEETWRILDLWMFLFCWITGRNGRVLWLTWN